MVFARHLREAIKRGRITYTIRFWTHPHVKVGGRYRMDEGHVVVDSIDTITRRQITKRLAVESGFESVEHLLQFAKHGKGGNIYLIRFHYLPPGAWDFTVAEVPVRPRGRHTADAAGSSPAFARRGRGIVKRRTLIWVAAAVNLAIAGAACSSASGDERTANGLLSGSGDEVTISGCLSAAADGRFALTAAPDATATMTTRGLDGERDTKTFILVGGDNLQAHLGKRVEVTGTVSGKEIEMEHEAEKKTEQPPATGGSDNRPVVKTEEAIDMQARQLNVRNVRDVAPTCSVTQ